MKSILSLFDISRDNLSRIFAMAGVCVLLAGFGGVLAAKADCTVSLGYGFNSSCLDGSACGACGGGVDCRYCSTETCGIGKGCNGLLGSQTVACVMGGCLNPFQGNCKCLPFSDSKPTV